MRRSILLAAVAILAMRAPAIEELIEPLPCVARQVTVDRPWRPVDAPSVRPNPKATEKPEQAPGSYG